MYAGCCLSVVAVHGRTVPARQIRVLGSWYRTKCHSARSFAVAMRRANSIGMDPVPGFQPSFSYRAVTARTGATRRAGQTYMALSRRTGLLLAAIKSASRTFTSVVFAWGQSPGTSLGEYISVPCSPWHLSTKASLFTSTEATSIARMVIRL